MHHIRNLNSTLLAVYIKKNPTHWQFKTVALLSKAVDASVDLPQIAINQLLFDADVVVTNPFRCSALS